MTPDAVAALFCAGFALGVLFAGIPLGVLLWLCARHIRFWREAWRRGE